MSQAFPEKMAVPYKKSYKFNQIIKWSSIGARLFELNVNMNLTIT
jgi:hypothetical protein